MFLDIDTFTTKHSFYPSIGIASTMKCCHMTKMQGQRQIKVFVLTDLLFTIFSQHTREYVPRKVVCKNIYSKQLITLNYLSSVNLVFK